MVIDKDALLNGNCAHQIQNPYCEHESHPAELSVPWTKTFEEFEEWAISSGEW